MANWYGTCRSNYFRVKDYDGFVEFLDQFEATLIRKAPDLVGFISDDEYGMIPHFWPEDGGDAISILDGVSEHLAENSVCVVIEAGAEKARYITGHAVAISHTGEMIHVSLGDIYAQAQEEFGGDAQITEAVY